MENLGVLSVVIPVLIIVVAIVTKNVVVSLLLGIVFGEFVIHDFHVVESMVALSHRVVDLFSEAWIIKTILFALFVGSIIRLITDSGGVNGFIEFISKKEKNIDSPKGALLLAYFLGIVIFIESSITSLVAGTVAKPLCDKNGVSREKLAFVCDSTSAPVCSLIPLNAWGALLLGLIATAIGANVISGDKMSLLVNAIAFNFYSIITVIFVLLVILFDINIGSMRYAKPHKLELNPKVEHQNKSPLLMILPIVVLIFSVPLFLYITGDGDILKGSGSSSVFYSVVTTLVFIFIYFVLGGHMKAKDYFVSLYRGVLDMIPITIILVLAFMIGSVIKDLGTANYLSDIIKEAHLSPVVLPAIIFLVASITSFSTGTSWGTFSIMMPIALSLGATFDIYLPLMIGAVISGGIFGDHVSPVSDTTIISSMASGCNHISHVKTQMPYALISALLAFILYLIFGFIL